MAIFNERRTNAAIAGGGEVHECRRRRRRRRSSPPLASEERRAGCASDARHFFFPKTFIRRACVRGKERKPATLSAFSRRRKKRTERRSKTNAFARSLLCYSFFSSRDRPLVLLLSRFFLRFLPNRFRAAHIACLGFVLFCLKP